MAFKDQYPDFAAIETLVRAARAERQVAVAAFFTEALLAAARGIKRLARAAGAGVSAEADRRAIESDAFLKRSVPKY